MLILSTRYIQVLNEVNPKKRDFGILNCKFFLGLQFLQSWFKKKIFGFEQQKDITPKGWLLKPTFWSYYVLDSTLFR